MMAKNEVEILKKYNVLYVEDNREIAEEIAFFFEPRFNNFYSAYDGQEGLEAFKKYRPDFIITDIQMPNMNGIEMIEEIRRIDSEVPIVITTAFNESSYLLKAINLQVDGYIMKPLNIKYLLNRIYKVIEPLELKGELISKNRELGEINQNLDKIVKDKTKELEYVYNHDSLTGLSNFISLGREIETGKYKYLLLLDISNFSFLNKQYGKEFSNTILKKTADKLKENINPKTRLFKTESDRFVILCMEEEEELIEEFSKQLISFFDIRAITIEDVEISINFSMGIAPITGEHFPIVNAEYALEIGKKIGSRYYHFYDGETESVHKVKENIKWLKITKDMIENDAIVPFYQPISDLKTGEIVKYEVLARGEYEGEFISPYFFIGKAEGLGLLSSITRMMVNKSFDYFKETDICFSINITQRDILDKQLILFLEEKVEKFNINPSRVTFEILENVTIGDQHELVQAQLRSLKVMGFKIAIDDFGVENSNFSRLLDIDFDYIKLDGSFIKGLVDNKKDRIVVAAIVRLADTLGIQTVAEFVENDDIYQIIKECGVNMAQGYHIGRPSACVEEISCAKK